MKKLKETLNKTINIRNSYIVGMILLILLLCVSTTSYALFTATAERQGALNIVTGNLYALIKSNSLDSNKQITLQTGESKTINVDLTNVNNIDAKFLMYYETNSNSVTVGCTENSDICPIENGIELTKNGTDEDTVTFNIQMTNDGETPATITFGANIGFADKEIGLVSGQHQLYKIEPVVVTVAAAKSLIDKSNIDSTPKEEEKKEEMYERKIDDTKKEYRYIGENPNNYITFNDEVWRIIGVFQTEDKDGSIQDRIKIIKDDPITSDTTDPKKTFEWSKDNTNNWITSSLRESINGDSYYNLLQEKSKNQIAESKWYLGNIDVNTISAEDAYNKERETTDENSKDEKSWIGNIGLMYPSDFGYTYNKEVDNTCFTNLNNCANGNPKASWLYKNINEWTITSLKDNTEKVFVISDNGSLNNESSNITSYSYRPVTYLRHDISFKQGTGTKEDPYIIEEN